MLSSSIGKLENSIADKDRKFDMLNSETATLKNKLLNSRNVGLFADLGTDRTTILKNKAVAIESEIEKRDEEIDLLKIKLESLKQSSFTFTTDELIMDLTSEKTLKDMQIANIQRKNDALEELLRTRYEHIKILEKDLDEKTFATKVNNNEKKQLLERVEKKIEVVEAM